MIKLPLQLNLTVDFLNGDPGGGSENVGLGGGGGGDVDKGSEIQIVGGVGLGRVGYNIDFQFKCKYDSL